MDYNKFTEYLDSLEGMGVPSVDCVVYKKHRMIYRHMNGHVDFEGKKSVSTDTLYLVFSMTKIQTMVAIMQLVEQGRLSLEDEVAEYLPAYKNIMVENRTEDGTKAFPASVPMKLKHLVSMQSGLDYNLEREGIKRVLREKGMKATTRELVDAFVETPLSFNPGTHFQYSLSHDVAAAVVEVVSGLSFGEYLRKNIWEPLGMKNTFFASPMNTDERLAVQYIYDESENKIKPMELSCCYQLSDCYESGGAGLISSTEDYALLGDALSNGGIGRDGAVILKQETIDIIRTNLLGEASQKDIEENMGRAGYGYGCGMQVLTDPARIGSPAPAGLFGWDGAAGSCMIMSPEKEMCVVFTMHVRGFGPAYGVIHPAIRDMVFTD